MNIKPLDVLHKYYGYTSFRKGQENIITSIINKEDVLAIMPTGGGKSICYQVPALCLDGITIVISPLISLMKDQVDALKTMGVKARLINSSLSNSEYNEALEEIENDECKIIYIAPERLDSMDFVNIIRGKNISQVAIDEAHCVSQWGHDFRVSYKKIPYFINRLDKRPIVTAFTATASNEVREDIINILNLHNPAVYITGFDRENLSINIVKSSSKNKYTLDYVENHKNESGIIYASTRKEVETIYEGLLKRNYSVAKYHAGLSNEARKEYQENFINDDIKIMVATNAFGMGIDKPNIRWVLHYNMPQSIENYYQEIGRGGRDGSLAKCYLLYSEQDIRVMDYLISSTTEISRRTIELKKLEKIIEFCNYDKCLRKYILDYFGEENSIKYCNNCTNCLKNSDLIDMTLEAQKILSCIYRTKEAFGESVLIDILRGIHGPKVEKYKLYELSTFGIMKEYTSKYIKDIIKELLSIKALERKEGTYSMVKLNRKSIGILKGKEKVFLDVNNNEESMCMDLELFKKLRILRKDISRREGVKPYIVFTDSMIMEIINKNPKSKEDLKNIRGFGEQKITKYGPFILTTLRDYEKYGKRN